MEPACGIERDEGTQTVGCPASVAWNEDRSDRTRDT